MREITIKLTEEHEKNLCKLVQYRNEERIALGKAGDFTAEDLLWVCAITGVNERLRMYE